MTTQTRKKLKTLLDDWPPHTVATYGRLDRIGVSRWLARDYVKNGWLERVGAGAFKRPNDSLTWQGALYSLQTQLGLAVHVGALTALANDGAGHFLRLGKETVFLFSVADVSPPSWFKTYDWQARLKLTQTAFLPSGAGVRETNLGGFALQASAPERAILECLHLAPKTVDLVETYHVLEGLRTLRPGLMQSLLESCQSIKVKRLFLFMADRATLPVMAHLKTDRIDLGSGDRALIEDGAYDAKYRLTVPKALLSHA